MPIATSKPSLESDHYDGSKRRNCRECQQYQQTGNGPRCRFRGGRPSGICAVFKRRSH